MSGGTLSLNGVINTTFTGGLNKTGAGTLVLNAVNTYTGMTSINGGILKLGIATRLPNQPLSINGATLDVNNKADTITTLTFNSGSIINTGAYSILTLGGNVTSDGTSDVASGLGIGLGTTGTSSSTAAS